VRLKWPNDIYVRAATDRDGAPHYEKVGGILVQTSTLGDHFHVISGIGLNVTNKRPTATLADVDPAVTQEKLLAEILLHLDRNMAIFARDRSFGFFRPQYERVWLHQHQDVSYRVPVPNGPDRIAQGRITGIDEQGHLLLDVGGNRISVMPDGNRFDFLRGLIYPA
ncbi:class II aaRS and biotin synthetase, partial [Caulochytrium protostelioides]